MNPASKKVQSHKLVLISVLLLVVTELLIVLSFFWEINNEKKSAIKFATIEARASFARDAAYRKWASMHGGVYVEINETIKPNPYLDVQNREIQTEEKEYTLVNPAYMNRQVYELDSSSNIKTTITSLNPINPINEPDEWEKDALTKIENGLHEVISLEESDNKEYLRLLKPFYVEESCLKCHAKQGYKLGQVRGGISITIPMSYFNSISKVQIKKTTISHITAFVFILLLYFWWYMIYRKQWNKQVKLQNELIKQKDTLLEINSELVSSKIKAEENEAFFKAALENSQAGIAIADMPNGNLLFVNNAGLLIRNKDHEDIVKDIDINTYVSSWQILHFDGSPYKPDEVPLARAVLYGETTSKEFIVRRDNNEDRIVWANAAPIFDKNKKQIAAIVVFMDITERKKAQDKLKERNEQLAIINNEYLQAKEKAEESERLKAAFLANMSHEIRTPMNGIMGFIEVLQNAKPDSKQQERYLDIIKRSGDRLLTTINNIVQISRIESGQIAVIKEEINICKFMDYFQEFFKPEADTKGVEVLVKCVCNQNNKVIYSDKNKLDSIITNLIKNALKFTEKGSVICNCNIDDDFIRFSVKDSGSGIQKERIKHIFDRFIQADMSLSRGYEGSGLGLSIVKAYVEMLGGKIWVESEEGTGSTFFFTIPHEASDNSDSYTLADKTSVEPKPHGKLRILIAEDDEVSYDLIRTILEKEGYEVVWAKDGREAIDFHNNEIDLILMDLKMPGMDGIEATKIIRKTDQKIPIIAQTAFAFPGDKELAKEAGCTDYISKPIQRKDLLSKINMVFS